MKKVLFFLFVTCTHQSSQIEVVEKADFKILIKQNYQLIDVRTPAEFSQGHIKNALNIDINSPNFQQLLSEMDKDQTILVYCAVGGRSAKAAKMMESLGFQKIYDLKGGYRTW
jgi:rhodanese-related sulfurtransferase